MKTQTNPRQARAPFAEPVEACKFCAGIGWYQVDVPYGHPLLGQSIQCRFCYDYLGKSRLNAVEQTHTLACLTKRKDDPGNCVAAMRYLCQQMLDNPYGFLSFQGSFGDGKSLALTALVAEFCRQQVKAQYWHINNILELIMPFTTVFDGEQVTRYDLDDKFDMLHRLPVLAIDEPDHVSDWSAHKSSYIGELIEYRWRNADTLVTLFAMNRPPGEWNGAERVGNLNSRLRDGSFDRAWDNGEKLPGCLKNSTRTNDQGKQEHFAPGFFEVNLPDVRPQLQRRKP